MKSFLKSFLFAIILPVMPIFAVEEEPVVILGGGVGSLTSALYLGRAGLSPLVIEGPTPGGLLTQSHAVQNWPGVMEIEGAQLTENMRAQAEANGARFLSEEVVGVDFSKKPLLITTRALDGSGEVHQISAQSCIIAMGTRPNFLGIPGEQDYWGKGVTNCAICDGSLYKDKIVGVVGGGDAAVLEALYLSNIAKEVHLFVRKGALKATEEKRVLALREKPNVKFHYNTVVKEVKGDGNIVNGVVLQSLSAKELPLDGLFLAIGSTPNSAVFKEVLHLDSQGYIVLKKDQMTSIEGVYAIGDIVDPIYKQAVSAAGDGAKAALQTQQYLSDRANKLVSKNLVAQKPKKTAQNRVLEVVSEEQFRSEVENSPVPVVIDFYASWCGPCKKVAPLIERSANELAGKYKFLKVNVDDLYNLSNKYNIRAMPTVIVLNPSGGELYRKVGYDQIKDLLKDLQK